MHRGADRLAGRDVVAGLRAAVLALATVAGLHGAAQAQGAGRDFSLIGANVQKRANAVLSLMGYSLTPDVTTVSLSLCDSAASNPGFRLTTLGGGFTWSKELPLYLEGTAAYSRYDPVFIASNGQESRPVPVRWHTVTGTGGVGWDFALTDETHLRTMTWFGSGLVRAWYGNDWSAAGEKRQGEVVRNYEDFLLEQRLGPGGEVASVIFKGRDGKFDFRPVDAKLERLIGGGMNCFLMGTAPNLRRAGQKEYTPP